MQSTLGDIGDTFGVTPDENPVNDITNIKTQELHFKHIDALAPFLAIAENIQEVNAFTAPSLIGKLSMGFRKAGEYLAVAKYNYGEARKNRKKAEAIVALDEFPKFIRNEKMNGREIKSTDDTRKFFVCQHQMVLAAIEQENFFEAIQEQLITMKSELFMAITTARSIAYGFKDANAIPTVATPTSD